MAVSISIEEANTTLLDLLERVSCGEEFTILKDGHSYCTLTSINNSLTPESTWYSSGND